VGANDAATRNTNNLERKANMGKAPHRPAAFINVIAEDGTKEEAIKYLQETWNDYMQERDYVGRLKHSLRVHILRFKPETSHEEIDTLIKDLLK